MKENLTYGQKIADKITEIAGSWAFIISFLSFLVFWLGINCKSLFAEVFDPFPFTLLNLFLSCLAAIQAPVILMSQNRQADKDRARLEHDIKLDAENLERTQEALEELKILRNNVEELYLKVDKIFKD